MLVQTISRFELPDNPELGLQPFCENLWRSLITVRSNLAV